MRIGCLFILIISSSLAWADAVRDKAELDLLPTYCRGTQQIRWISNDPKSLKEYVALYGEPFMHLHQYCWGLNGENNASKIRDGYYRQRKLESSLSEIQYSLDNSPPTFSLLPEMYLSKARVLFKLERNVEAVEALSRATQLNADYSPAYAQLGDYYQRIGDWRNAIKTFEQGYLNTNRANADFFIWKIRKLDKNYKIPSDRISHKVPELPNDTQPNDSQSEQLIGASAVNVPANQPTPTQPPAPPSPPNSTGSEAQNPMVDQTSKPNPYCRFCP